LRSSFQTRIEGLVRGVQGGIFAPNEARNTEGLPSVEGGDEPRVQQQVVPLTYWERQLELQEAKAAAPPPLPPAANDPNADPGAPPNPDNEAAALTRWLDVVDAP
jgi:hypothetical protein